MMGLTKRQHEVYAFIESYIEKHQFSPSFREIMKHFNFSSTASVSKHVNVLIRKGFLTSEKQSSRSLLPIQKNHQVEIKNAEIELPYIGYIIANQTIEMFEQNQTLAVPENLVHNPESTYILRAKGNSLNDEMILDGDLLLVEIRTDPIDGETVIAHSKTHKTLVKKYYVEETCVKLTSHSSHCQPILLPHEDLTIQGIVVSLLRIYS